MLQNDLRSFHCGQCCIVIRIQRSKTQLGMGCYFFFGNLLLSVKIELWKNENRFSPTTPRPSANAVLKIMYVFIIFSLNLDTNFFRAVLIFIKLGACDYLSNICDFLTFWYFRFAWDGGRAHAHGELKRWKSDAWDGWTWIKNGFEMGMALEIPKLWTRCHDGKLSERGTNLLWVWTGIVSLTRGWWTCIFADFDLWPFDVSHIFLRLYISAA